MLKVENTEVYGWEAAIRGMRNPWESWEMSDSALIRDPDYGCGGSCPCIDFGGKLCDLHVGPNDQMLMKQLVKAGTDHSKFMRYIIVTCDITAPMYWWKELDTYKVGTIRNSCSTMHKIAAKAFTVNDFSHEHLMNAAIVELSHTIDNLNQSRRVYLYGGELCDRHGNWTHFEPKDKEVWWQMIQLLPSSYNQKATMQFNYAVLRNMYHARKAHKLDEWRVDFCNWVKTLPYSELITMTKEEL